MRYLINHFNFINLRKRKRMDVLGKLKTLKKEVETYFKLKCLNSFHIAIDHRVNKI
jgi:hypothetical protein